MAEKRDMTMMSNCLCFKLRSVTRAVTRFFDAEVRRLPVRPTQTPILGALHAKDAWSMVELSEWLGMERTTLLRSLRHLERDGLVRINNGGGGRGRRVDVTITKEGRNLLAKTHSAWRTAQDKVLNILGKERWSNVMHDLELVAEELNKHPDAD